MTVKELLSCLEVKENQEARIIANNGLSLDATVNIQEAMCTYGNRIVESFTTGYGYRPVLKIKVEG